MASAISMTGHRPRFGKANDRPTYGRLLGHRGLVRHRHCSVRAAPVSSRSVPECAAAEFNSVVVDAFVAMRCTSWCPVKCCCIAAILFPMTATRRDCDASGDGLVKMSCGRPPTLLDGEKLRYILVCISHFAARRGGELREVGSLFVLCVLTSTLEAERKCAQCRPSDKTAQ